MASSPPIYCPLCGAVNLPDATSCVSCGHPLASTPSQQLLAPSALLRQRYRILGQAGVGGFSTVYRAEDTQVHNRVVAVKEISQRRGTPEDAQKTSEAFQQEAVLLAGLSHANLPRIHDYFQEGGRWYLVMEFLAGETLEARLRRSPGQRLPVPDALEVGLQLATVLEYLHTRQPPIIFRDLKPANVMLTAPLHAYLIDFGIARLFKPGQSKDTLVIGTIGYLAPEGYGKGQTTPRSDIYSLGVTLHQMLSGADPAEKPFHAAPLQSPVPPALAALVAEMVEMEEGRRPATMTLVKQRLQRMLEARTASPTDVLPRGIAALSPTQSPDQSVHPSPSSVLGPQLVQASPMPPPIQPRPGGVSRRAVAVGLGLGALVVGVGVVGILRQRPAGVVPPVSTTSGTESGFQVAPTSTFQSLTTPVPAITPTATPNTTGTVAYPPYRAHVGPVHFVLWSPTNGQEIVSTSVDGTLQVWNPQTLETRMDRLVYCQSLGWSANGQFFACGLMDNSVLLWNAVTDTIGLDYPSPQGSLAKLAELFSGKGSAARGMSPRNKKAAFGGGGVQALSWSPDNSEIVSAGNSGTIQIWNSISLNTRLSFGGQTNGVFALAWSPKSNRIASGSGSPNNQVYLWSATNGQQLGALRGHTDSIIALAWAPGGQYFASASQDHTVCVWNAQSLRLTFTYKGHTASVQSIAWSPDGKRLASAGQDGTVQLWDATMGANVFVYHGHTGSVNAVAWSPDGKHLASGGDDMSVQVWEAR